MLWDLKEVIQAIWKASWRRGAVVMSLKEYFSREERKLFSFAQDDLVE